LLVLVVVLLACKQVAGCCAVGTMNWQQQSTVGSLCQQLTSYLCVFRVQVLCGDIRCGKTNASAWVALNPPQADPYQ
jgi:hypothetical protein